MTQRHLIYVRLPAEGKKPTKVIGVYTEYLSGKTALIHLTNYLHLVNSHNVKDNPAKKHDTAYKILHDSWLGVTPDGVGHLADEYIEDPRKIYNETGITMVDLTEDKPKYAYMSTSGLECADARKVRHPNDPDNGQELWYKNFLPISATQWIQLHFGVDYKMVFKEKASETQDMINFVEKHTHMTVEDIGLMFPKMVSEVEGQGIYMTPNTLRFMDIVDKPIAVKSTSTTSVKIQSTVPRKKKKKTASSSSHI